MDKQGGQKLRDITVHEQAIVFESWVLVFLYVLIVVITTYISIWIINMKRENGGIGNRSQIVVSGKFGNSFRNSTEKDILY